jgi:predicted N-acetyltransferase YhbS
MTDMLVNLLKLPNLGPMLEELSASQILVRRAQPFEITPTMEFVEQQFSIAWADEISVGFANKPVSVFIATFAGEVVGFSAYECTRRNYFGPIGVAEQMRGRKVGKALVLASLWSLREMGYAYAIIGGVGPVKFYERLVGATVIPDSSPGIYTDLLNPN